jgi:ribosomal protein S18 acetylase RimI-like enzyme
MHVRTLGPADSALAVRTIREVKPEVEHRGEATDAQLEAFLRQASTVLVVALEGEDPVGYAVGYELPRVDGGPSMVHLYEIQVAEAFRRRGVGRRLVERMRSEVCARKAGSMWVLTDEDNAAALSLYTSCGARLTEPPQRLLAWRGD